MNVLEQKFTQILAEKIGKFAASPQFLAQFLVNTGLITQRTIYRFMVVMLYKKRLQQTKTEHKKRGCKALALHGVLNDVPISERSARAILCNYRGEFSEGLFS